MPDKKPLNIQIRKINKTSIYRQFLPGDILTKQELAGRLQLCIPTVVKNIDTLKEEGLIRQSGFKGNTGGRNAVAYALVPDARVALGVELTNDHVTIAALDLLGNIIASDRYQAAFCDTQAYSLSDQSVQRRQYGGIYGDMEESGIKKCFLSDAQR